MKLVVPINKAEEAIPLINAGAEELYCGIMPAEWDKEYSNIAAINRSERKNSNLKSFSKLGEIIARIHRHNVTASLALNSIYTPDQYGLLCRYIEEVAGLGIDAFVVSDMALLLLLSRMRTGVCF